MRSLRLDSNCYSEHCTITSGCLHNIMRISQTIQWIHNLMKNQQNITMELVVFYPLRLLLSHWSSNFSLHKNLHRNIPCEQSKQRIFISMKRILSLRLTIQERTSQRNLVVRRHLRNLIIRIPWVVSIIRWWIRTGKRVKIDKLRKSSNR